MMTTSEYEARIADRAHIASLAWFRKQCENPCASMFLYFLRHGMDVAIGERAPSVSADWVLASPMRVSPARTRAQIASWIIETVRSLPILPID